MQLTSEDPAVKQAMIANLLIDALVTVAGLALLAYQLRGAVLGETIKRKLRKLRSDLFGPPPPSEEQIKAWAQQVVVEAMRAVREAK